MPCCVVHSANLCMKVNESRQVREVSYHCLSSFRNENQPKEEVLGRISLRTSSQKLRSGPPIPGNKDKHFATDTPRGRLTKNFGSKQFGLFLFPILLGNMQQKTEVHEPSLVSLVKRGGGDIRYIHQAPFRSSLDMDVLASVPRPEKNNIRSWRKHTV